MITGPKTGARNAGRNMFVRIAMVFIFLVSMGFPGNYTRIVGSSMAMLMEYMAFFIQIGLMFYFSGTSFYDAKVINLQKRYNPVYITAIVWFLISMIATRDKMEQLISCVRVTETALFAVWVAEHLTPEEIAEDFCVSQVILVISCVLFATVFRAYYIRGASYAHDFVGIYGVKNQMASRLSFGLAMQIILLKIKMERGKQISKPFLLFMIIQIGLLLLTHGTGAMFITAIPALYLFFLEGKSKHRLQLGLIYDVGSIAFIVFALTILQWFAPLLEAIGEDATLTGRIPIWNQLIRVMKSHQPLTGYGYGMFWKDPRALALMHAGFNEYSWAANMSSGAHNSTLELWANTGLIGVGTYFLAMIWAFNKPQAIERDAYIFCVIFVLRHMMHGFTERNWGTYEFSLLFLFIAMAMAACRRTEVETETVRFKNQKPPLREMCSSEDGEHISVGGGEHSLRSDAAEG